MAYIVRESFRQGGFDTPTLRHYLVIDAESAEDAITSIRETKFWLKGVECGCVPGSHLSVIAEHR